MILPYVRLDLVQWSGRYLPPPLTAFCVLLRRLAYPERWASMMNDFGRSRSYTRHRTKGLYIPGYKRTHGVKVQAVVTPDGMIRSAIGGFGGKLVTGRCSRNLALNKN
ncbi:hypothetical protein V1509DRAFT_634941 [Lipomyces kononenkoae]